MTHPSARALAPSVAPAGGVLDPADLSVFVVSNEPWSPQHFIKHRFAIELARQQAEVFFCDPTPPWSPSNLARRRIDLDPIGPNLTLLRYRHPAPARLGERLSAAINDRVVGRGLRRLAGAERIPVLWQFDPFRFAANHLGPNSLKIYHVCDPYPGLALDERSAREADLIVCTSRLFADHYALRFPGKTIHVPHSSPVACIDADPGAGAATRERFGDYIFFGGSITDKVDISLLAAVAANFTDVKLLIAGPLVGGPVKQREFAKLAELPNVVHLGTLPAAEIPAYAAGAHVCLSAYELGEQTPLGPRTTILKVMDYLAQGKPVVSSSPLEYTELEGRAIFSRADLGGYVDAVGRVLAGELDVDAAAVDRFLAERTYRVAVERILAALTSVSSGAPIPL